MMPIKCQGFGRDFLLTADRDRQKMDVKKIYPLIDLISVYVSVPAVWVLIKGIYLPTISETVDELSIVNIASAMTL